MNRGIEWGRVTQQHDNIIIVCGGRSLSKFDFSLIKDLGTIIVVNTSFTVVPFADYWFTLDITGVQQPTSSNFSGKLYAAVPQTYGTQNQVVTKNITYLHRLISHNDPTISSESAYVTGLSEDNGCINTGNSGFGAFGLAYHMKPKKILILGMDGDIGYHYTDTRKNRPLTYLPLLMNSTVAQINKANIKVINGSINSSITAYPKYCLSEALGEFSK
jgi:hypothetical protein